ncbi:MAG: catalase family peroxidase [Arenimonas sp.]|nr:catalase family peroxidase [Arenimonas sp.]
MNDPLPPPGPPYWRRLAPFAGIAAVVSMAAIAFSWTAGWLTPSRLTAPRLVDAIENGKPYPGFRRAHAKGVCVAGYFEPTPEAAALSAARVFTQARTPVLGRLSIGGGDPLGKDAQARVRSLALQLQTDDGQEWRMAMNSFPFFAVSTPEAFAEQMAATRPDPRTGKPDPDRLQQFLARHPEAGKFMAWAKSAPWPDSWANTAYNGVHAFRFTDAGGASRYVRWSFVPQAPFAALDEAARQAADAGYLADEFGTRLAQGPVRWTLRITVAADGDPVDDPSRPWPAERAGIDAGTLAIDRMQAQAEGACRDINFDPTILPAGIAASGDPVLAARSAAYSASFNRRQRELAAGEWK